LPLSGVVLLKAHRGAEGTRVENRPWRRLLTMLPASVIDRMIAARSHAPSRWTAAERTAAKAEPLVKWCAECGDEFTRLYRDDYGRPRLRELRQWPRALYCSRACCAAYRGRKFKESLPRYLAVLEPVKPRSPLYVRGRA
jgi:hypothetical protein